MTLDSRPMASGDVTFESSDGSAPVSLPVSGGVFEGEVTTGKKIVKIYSYKETPAQPSKGPGYDQPQKVNIVDPRFSVNSQITKDIAPTGTNEFTFEVTSAKW